VAVGPSVRWYLDSDIDLSPTGGIAEQQPLSKFAPKYAVMANARVSTPPLWNGISVYGDVNAGVEATKFKDVNSELGKQNWTDTYAVGEVGAGLSWTGASGVGIYGEYNRQIRTADYLKNGNGWEAGLLYSW
jgi:hypothetical protein